MVFYIVRVDCNSRRDVVNIKSIVGGDKMMSVVEWENAFGLWGQIVMSFEY